MQNGVEVCEPNPSRRQHVAAFEVLKERDAVNSTFIGSPAADESLDHQSTVN